jgi:FtsH-binding integral membrane protein
MLRRWAVFGALYVLLGLPLAYMIVTSDEQEPWLIAFAAYFVVSALVGNWYVFFGSRFDQPTLLRWLAISAVTFGAIAIGYLQIVGAIDVSRLLSWAQ